MYLTNICVRNSVLNLNSSLSQRQKRNYVSSNKYDEITKSVCRLPAQNTSTTKPENTSTTKRKGLGENVLPAVSRKYFWNLRNCKNPMDVTTLNSKSTWYHFQRLQPPEITKQTIKIPDIFACARIPHRLAISHYTTEISAADKIRARHSSNGKSILIILRQVALSHLLIYAAVGAQKGYLPKRSPTR